MGDEKKSYYAIITANVRYDERLTPNAKLLYAEITALCNEKGYCWATNDYFAKLYKVSKTSVSKWINSLKNAGYVNIKIIYKDGDSKEILNRYITIVNDPIEEKFNPPIKEKFKDNTTKINNTINILSSEKSDDVAPVEPPILQPKKQETLYNTHTWKHLVEIYDKLHAGNGGGLINWKQEVRAFKDIVNILFQVVSETLPLITALYQVYFWVSKNDFVKKTGIDLTPNRLIKFISDETKTHSFYDHYDLLKKDISGDYKDYCNCFMSDEEKSRFDMWEVKK
jgi:DNA-binding transcriptional ArsR family regulator